VLASQGIDCAHALKGVGKNLQDHVGGFVQHRCSKQITYYNMTRPLKLMAAVLQYVFTRSWPSFP
jgi:choline dehydrogenase